jgi:hypothetical protein
MKKLLILILLTSCSQPEAYNKFAVFKKGELISKDSNKPSLYEGYLKNDTIYLKRVR